MRVASLRALKIFLQNRKREDHRPWGFYRVLADEPDLKVKTITVYPDKRLSLQRHHRRAEHWYVAHGSALVTRDGEEIPLEPGQAVDIPRGAWHRMRNPGDTPLVFVEVQTGDYFGEDDIERAEDDYGRA
jgi:mannose-6-phosphate isomerase-like protein (cupin superfamily)